MVQGTKSPQEAADRLLSSVYMAIVSDVGEAEGLDQQQVRHRSPSYVDGVGLAASTRPYLEPYTRMQGACHHVQVAQEPQLTREQAGM